MSALRRLTKLVLVLSLALSTQSLLVVQTLFVVRQDYIAEHFCVNRDKPEKHCDGKCFLADRVAETQRHHEDGHEKATPNLVLPFHLWLPARAALPAPPPQSFSYLRTRTSLPETPFTGDLFRPPRRA